MIKVGFQDNAFIQIGVKAANDIEEGQQADETIEDPGRSPIWKVFGAWKF